MLHVNKYPPKHPLLKQLIKYFWVLKSEQSVTLSHKLLPVNNIDVVLNFSSPMKYSSGGNTENIPSYSFSGIRDHYYIVQQTGILNMFGISFFPAGLYPLIKIPLSEFTNQTVGFDLVVHKFNSMFEARFCSTDSVEQQIAILEDVLLQLIDPHDIPPNQNFRLLSTFHSLVDRMSMTAFCDHYGISQRTLERAFKEYIGVSPQYFKRLHRFQGVVNQILNNTYLDFTALAYENDYYDQAHFIKDFKSLTGCPPSQFVKEKRSVKEILTY